MSRMRKSKSRSLALLAVGVLGFASIIGTDGDDDDTPAPPPQQSPPPPITPPPAPPPNPIQFGTAQQDVARGVVTDSAGNVIVAGFTAGALDGNTSAGLHDAILIKYRPDGTRAWTRQFGSAEVDEAEAVATDAAGNIYVVGFTHGSIDGAPYNGSTDIFVAKYNTVGNRIWLQEFGTPRQDVGISIAVTPGGIAYIAGVTYGSFDGNVNAGAGDWIISKLDPLGFRTWSRQLGSAGEDAATDIALDAQGNAYITGSTSGSIEIPHQGSDDFLLAKYDAAGNPVWLRQNGTDRSEFWLSVALDNAGGVYVAGHETVVGSVNTQVRVNKFTVDGSQVWAAALGGPAVDVARAIAVDETGVYVTGYTEGGLEGIASAGSRDAFLIKFDPVGPLVWARLLGTTEEDVSVGASARAGVIHIAGGTNGAFPGNTNAGNTDGFVARFGPDGNLR